MNNHLIRVSTVFIASPLIIWLLVDDFDGRALPAGQVHLWQTGWLTWLQYPIIAAVGLGVGKALRFPLVWLLGPMAVSAVWAALVIDLKAVLGLRPSLVLRPFTAST